MRVLWIVHADSDPPGVFSQVVGDACEHDEWRVDRDPEPPSIPESYDAIAVFGGYMDPDDDQLDWLWMEKDLLRDLVRRGVPLFGVCLGAQLLAEAAGARIYPLDSPEIGWGPIELLPDARRDPVFGPLETYQTVFEWHSWTFDLPRDGIPLAVSASCLQAFRLPPNVWGVQFHAEVTPDKLSEWLEHAATDPEARRAELDPARQLVLSRRFLPGSMQLGRALSGRFLHYVASLEGAAAPRAARERSS